ncbi:MAG: phosphoesterase [Oxalobacter sp.]|nr:MAG: phosphoesterase [Oxalobacter sp.]
MKIHFLSDIHLEFGKWTKSIDVNAIDADVTVLAGDIGVGLEGIQWALTIERPVIYVMGNHEFYGQRKMAELWRKAREKVAGTHVHLLENESVLINTPGNPLEQVRFIGAVFWTDFCLLGSEQQEQMMDYANHIMTDYSRIFVAGRRAASFMDDASIGQPNRRKGTCLTPRMTLSLHHESRDYITHELQSSADSIKASDSNLKNVVVTHHAPSALSLLNQQVLGASDAAYASELDVMVAKANLWIHGHTHIFADYRIGRCRVVSNPRGYAGHEKIEGFNPLRVVEI